MARRIVFTDSGFWKYSWAHLVMSMTESCRWVMQCRLRARRPRASNKGLQPCPLRKEISPVSLNIFFVINIFYFFSHITQHSIQHITKQNNRHILNISKSSQKGGREGRTIKTQESLLYTITYIKQKPLPSINGRRPGPTDLRRCTFTSHYLQEATDPICFSTHVRCKPVLYYCLLCSCKTSKQHSLLHLTYTETRIIIKKTQTWVNKPINLQ